MLNAILEKQDGIFICAKYIFLKKHSMTFHDFKWPIVILLLGVLTQFTGALFKLRHWPMADELITIGYGFCAIAIIFAIVKIALSKKKDSSQ